MRKTILYALIACVFLILSLVIAAFQNSSHLIKNNTASPTISGTTVVNRACLLIDSIEQAETLKKMQGKLIFFFSTNSCSSCIFSQLEAIKNIEPKIGQDNLMLVGDFKTKKDLLIFKEANPFKFKVYRTQGSLLMDGKIEPSFPFFFVFNQQGSLKDYHICENMEDGSTTRFLKNYFKI